MIIEGIENYHSEEVYEQIKESLTAVEQHPNINENLSEAWLFDKKWDKSSEESLIHDIKRVS